MDEGSDGHSAGAGADPAGRDQRLQVRLGRMGLAGAVLVALLSLGGVFIGSLVQSRSDSATTGQQVRQADAAYMRAQRKEAYVAFLTANRKLLEAEQDVLLPEPDLARPDPLTEPGPDPRALVRLGWREFLLAIDVIQIVGPDELLPNVDILRLSHLKVRDEISRAAQRPAPRPTYKRLYSFRLNCVIKTANGVAADLRHALETTEDRVEVVVLGRCFEQEPPD